MLEWRDGRLMDDEEIEEVLDPATPETWRMKWGPWDYFFVGLGAAITILWAYALVYMLTDIFG